MLYSFILDATVGLLVIVFREGLARIFTVQEELIPLIKSGYVVMVYILLIHGMAMVQAGAARGLGMLSFATWLVFIAFYVVSLPLAYYFTFPLDWGMVGLWWGVVCGSLCEVILYFVLLSYVCDWKRLAIKISMQMRHMSPDSSFKKSEQIHEKIIANERKTSLEY